MTILSRDFYNRDTLIVAQELLGCKLCRRIGDKVLEGIIVETEAYKQHDPACHAFRGKTKRAITLFKEPGLSYVYLIYGMYNCMNVVTEPYDTAGAVLIRALEPLGELVDSKGTNGPGKLCREMQITKELNEIDITNDKGDIWVERGSKYKLDDNNIVTTTRIGIKVAEDYPWRFYIRDNRDVSKL